ncbi:hypothetical protein KO507_02290 [Gilvimarinus agarilyticus]|uniref:hypothetical protein n=1 Tax=unclassified Gilvimarinus TaxID=2642066 RepID=UPI001C08898D|nr:MULTISPECIES: hypothetical protein [unclassified Gilvimarinus]MBU2884588.1 hypothetical protein [Gilvimarinus agarilyticus]MDO6569697.1 hypothetical protein [Gilvimarinus sp. 2_MG-2023]MDO6748061.1 hypothetical protein [Gilvimarinus sp. 1_MG-2023]
MHLQELIEQSPYTADSGVPDWMLGFFKRRSISFANGDTDLSTHVCWLQSRNFTIDLRLPIEAEQVAAKPWQDYSAVELRRLGNYEGWVADSVWNGETLAWQNEMALQLHGRWLEPAYLKRIGNCMMEFCPSNAYVEDWRLQPSQPGPLIGLRLTEEKNLSTGVVTTRGGGLIVCGDYAALVLARPGAIDAEHANALREKAVAAVGNGDALASLFEFETSVAQGSLTKGYKVTMSTQPNRVGEPLLPLDGFTITDNGKTLKQCVTLCDGTDIERLYRIDTLEPMQSYSQITTTTAQANQWFEQERETLCRYTKSYF